MPDLQTPEFSICLLPDAPTSEAVNAFRNKLPPSPYRDDPPHLTFIQGILAASEMTDEALRADISPMLHASPLPFTGTVKEVGNGPNDRYSLSSGLLIDLPPGVLDHQTALAQNLESNGYTVDPEVLARFIPHITIRLGVPLEGALLAEAQSEFTGRPVTFSQWFLYRLILRDGHRFGREVPLG